LTDTSEGGFKEKYDTIVVGAGIVGLSSAYHIISEDPSAKVLVIEKALSAGQGDSGKSAAGVRTVFTSGVNRLLAETSIDFYSHLQNDLKIPVNLDLIGYLWLLTDRMFDEFSPRMDKLQRDGVRLRIWDQKELAEMLPEARLIVRSDDEEAKLMRLESISKGVQGLKCGTVAPEKLIEFYANEIRKMGVELRYGERVTSLIIEPTPKLNLPTEPFVWEHVNFAGVRTSKSEFRSDSTILATGAWTSSLLDPLGIDCHIRTKKRQLFTFRGPKITSLVNSKGFNKQNRIPMTFIPPTNLYFRPNSADSSLWVGVSDHLGRSFSFEEDPIAEEEFYEHNIYPVLSHYFPAFVDARPFNKWAGHYDMNTIDGNPYVFGASGLVAVAGCSGSGMQKADAIGRIVAAASLKKDMATLFGGRSFKVSRLGVEKRDVEHEDLVI